MLFVSLIYFKLAKCFVEDQRKCNKEFGFFSGFLIWGFRDLTDDVTVLSDPVYILVFFLKKGSGHCTTVFKTNMIYRS